MQHIDRVFELCHVEDAIFTFRVDSNLTDSGTDDWNRLPIAGRTTCLNQTQLIADFATGRLGEPSQTVTTISEPLDRLCTTPHSLRLYRSFIIGMDHGPTARGARRGQAGGLFYFFIASWMRSRKRPFMPAAKATLSSPNLSRSWSTAVRALRQRASRSDSSRLSWPARF